jgi:hypothetical protein
MTFNLNLDGQEGKDSNLYSISMMATIIQGKDFFTDVRPLV